MEAAIYTPWKKPEGFDEYLKPTQMVDSTSSIVQETAEWLITGCRIPNEAVRVFFHYIRDDIHYGRIPLDTPASGVIKAKKGNCTNKSVAFVALCRASNIPSRILYKGIKLQGISCLVHPWLHCLLPPVIDLNARCDVFLDEKWITIETELDPELYKGLLKRKLIHPLNVHWDGKNNTTLLDEYSVQEMGTFISPEEPVAAFHASLGRKKIFLKLFYWMSNRYIEQSRRAGRF